MPKSNITLNDIAKELGVSKVTISKALRDHPDISDSMKEKVRRTADKMGYIPNYMARSLSSQKSHTIGLLVPKMAHHFYATCIEAIYKAAYSHDYDIIMTVSQENPENERQHIQTLLSMKVDGILASITEKTEDDKSFEIIKKRNIPLVYFDRVFENKKDNYVVTNDREASRQLIDYVIKAGYTDIAHLTGYKNINVGRERELGFRDAMKANDLEINEEWVIHGGINEKDGYQGLMKIAKKSKLPQVIYAFTFPMALGIYTAARELGLKISKDIEVVCFGVGRYNRYLTPAMTYMKQPAAEIGRKALELLLAKIQENSTATEQIVIPSKLEICDTCKPDKT